jgi:hypothetical protein
MLSREGLANEDGQSQPEELPDSPRSETSFPGLRVAPFLTDAQRNLVRRSLCKKLDDDQAAYFFEVVERTRLDPFTAQIRPDIRSTKDADGVKHPTLLVIVTLQGLRGIGERSGKLDGEDPIEWCDAEGKWYEVWLRDEPPAAARATVYRTDRNHPQVTTCRWEAFVQKVFARDGKEVPNPFWRRMGSHMLGKCALAGSYRGLFPNLCSGVYLEEELPMELDPESEPAIEAEMARRAAADKEHWDQERAKGNFPVNEQPPPPPEKNGKKKAKEKAPAPAPPPPPEPSREPVAPPAPPVAPVTPPARPEPSNAHEAIAEPLWKNYVLNRIKVFAGRTVGSLNKGELRAAQSMWMPKVEASWANIDSDLKEHYSMLMQRIEHEDALDRAAAQAAAELDGMSEEAKRATLDEQFNDQLNDMQLPFSP